MQTPTTLSALRVGVIGQDATILDLVRDVARSCGARLEVFGSFAELLLKVQLEHLKGLVIDVDSSQISLHDLANKIEYVRPCPAVMLIGGTELAKLRTEIMPNCVWRIAVREGGGVPLFRSVHSFLLKIS